MRNLMLGTLLAAAIVFPTSAKALRIAMPSYNTPQKAVLAETVVVGKVTSVETDTVELETFPGSKEKAAFSVAVIKIETALVGAKNVTHIKVAFPAVGGAAPAGRPVRFGMQGPVAVTEGQEGIFFLVPYAAGSAYQRIPAGFEPLAAGAANYKEELAKVQAATATLADPLKALKAEKLEDRQAAVSLLGQKYRRGPLEGGQSVAVPMPEDEAKLILATILETDWKAAEKPAPNFDHLTSGPGMASAWGLYPGQNGIPKFVPKPGENYNARWKAIIDEWAKTDAAKTGLKKLVAKK